MQEGRIDSLVLGKLAKGTVYVKSRQDLARKLIGDPTRQAMMASALVVIDGLEAMGLITKTQEPDLLNIDRRFECGPLVWAYSLTDAGKKALAKRSAMSQG